MWSSMNFKPVGLAFVLLLLSGCGWQMADQPRYEAYEPTSNERSSARIPPAQTVKFRETDGYAERPELTAELLERGQERYTIYCALCHGERGRGDGRIVQRGLPAPPSFHEPRLKDAPDSHFWSAITNGAGRMYPYADRVSPEDRWAIVEWIRVIQSAEEAKDQGAKS